MRKVEAIIYHLKRQNPGTLTNALEWYNLGEEYYQGFGGLRQDLLYLLAYICYSEAIKLKPNHKDSLYSIGLLYQHGRGVQKSSTEAKFYYHRAFIHGCKPALFRLGENLENGETKKPFGYLIDEDLNQLLTDFTKSPPKIMITRIAGHQKAPIDRNKILKRLEKFYRNPQIRPLLDLAKLAALGLHRLSKLDYDSDNSDTETYNPDKPHLTIIINPTVDRLKDSNQGVKLHGFYRKNNRIFLAGKRSLRDIVGTLIHELTHFIAEEVFDNDCNPYLVSDKKNSADFAKIASDLESKNAYLDRILQKAFSQKNKDSKLTHAELIVRVPQMIIYYGDLRKVQQQAPALLHYYNNVFLAAVDRHISIRIEKMVATTPYSFSHTSYGPRLFDGRHSADVTSPKESASKACWLMQTRK